MRTDPREPTLGNIHAISSMSAGSRCLRTTCVHTMSYSSIGTVPVAPWRASRPCLVDICYGHETKRIRNTSIGLISRTFSDLSAYPRQASGPFGGPLRTSPNAVSHRCASQPRTRYGPSKRCAAAAGSAPIGPDENRHRARAAPRRKLRCSRRQRPYLRTRVT